MTDFRDYLLNDPPREERDKRARLEALEKLIHQKVKSTPPSLKSLIQNHKEIVFGVSLAAPDSSWRVALDSEEIQFSLLHCDGLEPQNIRSHLQDLEKPLIKVLPRFSEDSVLEARLQGFTGYAFPLSSNDLSQIQFGLEYGLDYGMEGILTITDGKYIDCVQNLDCPILKISSSLSREEINRIPSTRVLLFDLKEMEQVDSIKELHHRVGVLLNQKLIKT